MFGTGSRMQPYIMLSIFCCKQSLYLSQQMNVQMDTDGYCISMVHWWETGFGLFVCVCLSECTTSCTASSVCWVRSPPPLSLCFLAPWITQNALLPGSLEVCWVCLHAHRESEREREERERERGREGKRRKEDKVEIMSVHVYMAVSVRVHLMFVCAANGGVGEEKKKKKSTWPADKAAFSKYSNKKKTKEKQPTRIYPCPRTSSTLRLQKTEPTLETTRAPLALTGSPDNDKSDWLEWH